MKFLFFLFLLLLPISAFARFDRNLYFGMRNNADVKELQDLLRTQGFFSGPSTGNYFQGTLNAVKQFQQAHGLQPVGGYFGPQSRALANTISPSSSRPSSVPSALGSSFIYAPAIKPAPSPTSAVFAASPYKGKITLESVSGWSDRPENESVTLANVTEKEKIVVTGFSLLNSHGGSFTIPEGHEIPGFNPGPEDPITLKPHDRARITAGRQETWFDFRENICTGYLDENVVFNPRIAERCPTIDTRNLSYLTDRCLQVIQSTPGCRQPDPTLLVDSECRDFMGANMNYGACVRDNRRDPGFFLNTWFIWMQRDDEFIRNVHETIVLRDQGGREVDRYSY